MGRRQAIARLPKLFDLKKVVVFSEGVFLFIPGLSSSSNQSLLCCPNFPGFLILFSPGCFPVTLPPFNLPKPWQTQVNQLCP